MTLRIGTLEEGKTSLDHEATWLLGHTQHITFTDLWAGEGDLYADAVLHVPCKFLRTEGGEATCGAYGFRGRAPRPRRIPQPRQLGGNRFRVVDDMRLATRRLPPSAPAPRSLPVLAPTEDGGNPCAGAPCATADHKRGAACCRDLQIEIMCTRAQRRLEALVRSRRSPYLCKISRPGEFSIEAEMISACAYLEPGGVNCTLHGRDRADGRPAKPDLCSAWPEKKTGLHPGCVFMRRRRTSVPAPTPLPAAPAGPAVRA
ncbi:MAG TPA: hypothetical protein VFS40_13375 [Gemmatimonadales bacterium]|nr:hypothetical protein [Gemmatimonadales bacterium]